MKIIHFADLHLGVETYGRTSPDTGVSTRLEDFLAAFDKLVDYALENKVDLVLFCGDAYKSREPSQTQQRELARRIRRLAEADIPIFILIGNHDLPNAVGKATSTEIFDTLAVQKVIVSNKPEVRRIKTKSGEIQVASLPWLRRSALLKRDENRILTIEQINQNIQKTLTNTVEELANRLDPALPAILAAHISVDQAELGSEKMMSIGQEPQIMLSNLANPAFDYIALGHIHKRQVLKESPPVVYSGSLERVDFGEEADDKGFYVVDIQHTADGKRNISYEFHKINGRTFITVDVKLDEEEPNPTEATIQAIRQQVTETKDAIIRVRMDMPEKLAAQIRENEIRDVLKDAYWATLAKETHRETRTRFSMETDAHGIMPLDALRKYLDANLADNPERVEKLMEYGQRMVQGEESLI